MNRGVLFGLLTVVGSLACGGGSGGQAQLAADVRLEAPGASIASVEIDVLSSADACAGSASSVARASIGVGDAQAGATSGSSVDLGRVTFSVAPGSYRVCALPLGAGGAIVQSIPHAETIVTLSNGATVEITLVIVGTGDGGVVGRADGPTADGSGDAAEASGSGGMGGSAGVGGAAGYGGGGQGGTGATAGAAGGVAGSLGGAGGSAGAAGGGGAVCNPSLATGALALTSVDLDGNGVYDGVYQSTDSFGSLIQVIFRFPDGSCRVVDAMVSLLTMPITLAPPPLIAPTRATPFATGDFTGDGRDDLFVVGLAAGDNVRWIVLSTTGSGASIAQVTVTMTTPAFNLGVYGSVTSLAAGNIDADGHLDVTAKLVIAGMLDHVGGQPQTVSVYGNGDGTFHCATNDTVAQPNAQAGGYPPLVCQSTGVY